MEKWYRSQDDGPWEPMPPPSSGSLLRLNCQTPGQVWHDGYGNQYRFELVES